MQFFYFHSFKRYLLRPSTASYDLINTAENPDYSIYVNFKTFKFYRRVLRELFERYEYPIDKKFFIEAGAMDGQYQSNTLYLEQNLNWTGLLLEPDHGMFQLLQRKNRKAWSANVCLSPHYYPYKVNKKLNMLFNLFILRSLESHGSCTAHFLRL